MITIRWVKLTAIAFFFGIICLPFGFPLTADAIEVDPELIEQFKTNETAGYVIYFRAKANLSGAPSTNWKEQNEFINHALQETANRSQARVRSYLFGNKVPYRSVWKDNIIVVEKSDRGIFEGLLSFAEIEAINVYKTQLKTLPKTLAGENKESGADTKPY